MPAPRFQNLVEMFARAVSQHRTAPLFGTKRDGAWRWATYGEIGERVDRLRSGLTRLGVAKGDAIGLLGANSPEWAVVAYACYGLGARLVPMYEAQRPADWEYICADAGVRVLFASRPHVLETCRTWRARVPSLEHLIGIERASGEDGALAYADVLARGAERLAPAATPASDEPASIIYTAGTSGLPKGVVLSHGNIASNVAALQALLPLSASDRSLSLLPWAHAFGHTCELHGLVSLGASIAIAESGDRPLQDLGDVAPTVLVSVPRVLHRLCDVLTRHIATSPRLVRTVFGRGVAAAAARERRKLGLRERLELETAERVVFARLRSKLGGRLRYVFSGGASLAPKVAELVAAIGIPVYEGYGLTEAGPVVSANSPRARRPGSVGRPLPGVTVTIDGTDPSDRGRGEIVVHGPGVMQHYHDRPAETAATLTPDHGLRTGDIGYLDRDGYLFLSGRLKDRYELSSGLEVAPGPLEEALKLSPLVANALVDGDGRTCNAALIVPDLDRLARWAAERGLHHGNTAALLASPEVRALFDGEIARCSQDFRPHERVARYALVEENFTTENGLLTPSHAVRRSAVLARHAAVLAALHG